MLAVDNQMSFDYFLHFTVAVNVVFILLRTKILTFWAKAQKLK
jgi:hypothetical protein